MSRRSPLAQEPDLPVSSEDGETLLPMVAGEGGNRPLWIGLIVIGLIGFSLFLALEARRQRILAPIVKPRASDLALAPSSSPPYLYVPPEARPQAPVTASLPSNRPMPVRQITPAPPTPAPRLPKPQTLTVFPDASSLPPTLSPTPIKFDESPAIVFDSTAANVGTDGAAAKSAAAVRAKAERQGNRSAIVPQGTLISAVLETAMDSTQPGQVRAIVSSDVPNLVGRHSLIPRGSRLFGEYRGKLEAGQNRAVVQWSRLVRPDGVAVAIDSPTTDRMGRAGVKGKVNTHFFERFSSALLQSAIDIGTFAASQAIYDPSVQVSVGGAMQGASQGLVDAAPAPTIVVKQGTQISVFVIRDLDFSGIDGSR